MTDTTDAPQVTMTGQLDPTDAPQVTMTGQLDPTDAPQVTMTGQLDPTDAPQVTMTGQLDPTDAPQVTMTGQLDPTEGWSRARCPMAATLGVVSTRTAFLLLREAFYGAHRFEEFVARAAVSEPVAAARLRELVDHGLMERAPYQDPGQRTRSGYRLTQKGADLLPALVALMDWGSRWAVDGDATVALRHAGCGDPVHAVLRCDAGHDVPAGDLELVVTRPGTAA